MPLYDLEYEDLIKGLTDNFNVLADEVQLLSDRKTILEHKLRFAAEQYQKLADKYASGDSEISSTLAKLQLPPDLQVLSADPTSFVPLPKRTQPTSKLQTAVVIRDGRRAAQCLAGLTGRSTGSTISRTGSRSNLSYSARRTSLSTVLEQDFTVEGKKGSLSCPFSRPTPKSKPNMNFSGSQASGALTSERPLNSSDIHDPTPHRSADPICAAMYAETNASAPPPSASGSGAKCPIRYLDQHSPEEVARYFETHKHEIPRSHEVCVKRYQRNEDDIRKLDAKYGNLVSMIQGLGQTHQPMLPTKEEQEALEKEMDEETEHVSNERVESWANNISADGIGDEEQDAPMDNEEDRESRFDRPLKEIRVGESPSRPWGISVPILDPPERVESPPPAPVAAGHLARPAGKCPFGHGAPPTAVEDVPTPNTTPQVQDRPIGKCPFGNGAQSHVKEIPSPSPAAPVQERPAGKCPFGHDATKPADPVTSERPMGQRSQQYSQKIKEEERISNPPSPPATHSQPTFTNPSSLPKQSNMPQMVFTGPVFIGYPMDQALAFMQQYKGM